MAARGCPLLLLGSAGGLMTSWPRVSVRKKVISGCGEDDGGFWGVVVDGENFSVRSSRLCKMFRSEGISMWYCRSAGCEIVICDMRYAIQCDMQCGMWRAWRCSRKWIKSAETLKEGQIVWGRRDSSMKEPGTIPQEAESPAASRIETPARSLRLCGVCLTVWFLGFDWVAPGG